MLVARDEIDSNFEETDDCRDFGNFDEADDEMINAVKYFWDDECPCDLEDPDELSDPPSGKKFEGTAKRIQDCPCDDDSDSTISSADGILEISGSECSDY